MKRILAVRVSALGDVVLATPALRALKARFPDAELHLVTDGGVAPVLEGLPFVSRVHRWEPRGRHVGARGLSRFAAEVGEGGRFDLAVDLQNKLRTRALVALLRPREAATLVKRQGIVAAARALVGSDTVLDAAHAVELYHQPLASFGVVADGAGPELVISEAARASAARLIGDEARPLVALAPGARWGTKRWEARRFAEVGDALARAGAAVVLVGGPGDAVQLEEVRGALAAPPVGDTAGLDVGGLLAVLARAALVVTNDSAPSHLAQAVGTPVVALFGPTSVRRWGPLPGGGAALSLPVACRPCSNHGTASCPLGHHACLQGLPASLVAELALAALSAGRATGGAAAFALAQARTGELEALAAAAVPGAP